MVSVRAMPSRDRVVARCGLSMTSLKRTAQVTIAAHHRFRPLIDMFVIHESAKPDDFVDDQSRRNLAVIHRNHTRNAAQRRTATTQHQLQIDKRQQMTPQIGNSENPAPGAGNPGYRLRQHQHLADLVTVGDELFMADAKPNPDPFRRQVAAGMPRNGCSTAALDFLEQFERLLNEFRQRD